LNELKNDVGLSNDFIAFVEDLNSATGNPKAGDVIARMKNIPIMSARMRNNAEVRDRVAVRAETLRQAVASTVDGIIEFAYRTATPDRSDRLFPSDLMVFRTNPQSVAYGAAGVIYSLNRIHGCVPIELRDWLLRKPVTNSTHPPGLYVGKAGIAWILAELGYLNEAAEMVRTARSHSLLWQSPNIMYGASGYGMACLKLWSLGAGEEFLEGAIGVGHYLVQGVVRDGRNLYWRDDSGVVKLGYAYGGSGISLFLLYLHLATQDPSWFELGRGALDFELSQAAFRDGRIVGFPAEKADEPTSTPVLKSYWDAGSAGVITTLVRYLAKERDPELEAWVPLLQSDIARKYVVFPQLFHGLAGLGNSLLDLWEYDFGNRPLEDAWRVAAGILLFRIKRKEGFAFPGEQAIRESADFATGSAGIALFLHRLLQADKGIRSGNFNFVVDNFLSSEVLKAHLAPTLTPCL
jgi:hypothetical protein